MNVDDLQWQAGTLGGVLPRLVDEIRDRGGLEALVQAAREREDWFCAVGAVRELCAVGELGRAWAVVEPFAASRWQPAVRVAVDVLVQWGRVDQALELARPEERKENAVDASRDYAVVLVRAGRVEEAIGVLGPHLRGGRVLTALVEMTEGQGCDEQVLELLAPIAEEFRRDPEQPGIRDLWEVMRVWDRLNTHVSRRMREHVAERAWLTVFLLHAYSPDFHPVEWIQHLSATGSNASSTGPTPLTASQLAPV
ncbi:hypothetical protein [Streptomyces sp. NPDC001068]|uniref:hypothetical protein n=1 Tax=Streptomyces sp. NPDC001068 TaxID=3364544 RepID=UPI0036873FD3